MTRVGIIGLLLVNWFLTNGFFTLFIINLRLLLSFFKLIHHEKDLIAPFSDNILQSGRGMHHPSCSLIDIYL